MDTHKCQQVAFRDPQLSLSKTGAPGMIIIDIDVMIIHNIIIIMMILIIRLISRNRRCRTRARPGAQRRQGDP